MFSKASFARGCFCLRWKKQLFKLCFFSLKRRWCFWFSLSQVALRDNNNNINWMILSHRLLGGEITCSLWAQGGGGASHGRSGWTPSFCVVTQCPLRDEPLFFSAQQRFSRFSSSLIYFLPDHVNIHLPSSSPVVLRFEPSHLWWRLQQLVSRQCRRRRPQEQLDGRFIIRLIDFT